MFLLPPSSRWRRAQCPSLPASHRRRPGGHKARPQRGFNLEVFLQFQWPPSRHTNICQHLCLQVDKNLRESSDENLMEHSQKQFGSESQPTNVLHHQVHTAEGLYSAWLLMNERIRRSCLLLLFQVNSSPSTSHSGLRAVRGVDSPPSSIHPLPKQQNLPQRPTSLHLLPKVKESGFTSSRLKLGKFKSNHRQVGLRCDRVLQLILRQLRRDSTLCFTS